MQKLMIEKAHIAICLLLCAGLSSGCGSDGPDTGTMNNSSEADQTQSVEGSPGTDTNMDSNASTEPSSNTTDEGNGDQTNGSQSGEQENGDAPLNNEEETDTTSNVESTVDENTVTDEPDSGAALAAIEIAALQFIHQYETATGFESGVNTRYYKLTTPLTSDPVLQEMAMLDTCNIGSAQSEINAEFLNFPIDHVIESTGTSVIQVQSISGGEAVDVASDAGSHFSLLPSTDSAGDIDYNSGEGGAASMMVPERLISSNSGAEFPMINVTWDKPQDLEANLRNAVRGIGAEPQLQWTPLAETGGLQSRVHLYAGFLDELTGDYQSFECQLADDGEFTVPENIQNLFANGFTANFVTVGRYTRTLEFTDNAAIVNVYLQTF